MKRIINFSLIIFLVCLLMTSGCGYYAYTHGQTTQTLETILLLTFAGSAICGIIAFFGTMIVETHVGFERGREMRKAADNDTLIHDEHERKIS